MPEGEERRHDTLIRRLRGMGLQVDPLAGGRCAEVTLPLGRPSLPTAEGARLVREIRFVTVGATSVKCIEPSWLFVLPLISVAGCDDPSAIERCVRDAWSARLRAVARIDAQLSQGGVETELEAAGGVLAMPLDLVDGRTHARMVEPGRVILPSRGPLTGLPLDHPSDRSFAVEPNTASAVELEIAITGRLELLAASESQEAEAKRKRRLRDEPLERTGPSVEPVRPRVLLVGTRLSADASLIEGLRLRNYDVVGAATSADALRAFSCHSFGLVLVDSQLGRGEGVELIPAVRELAGVEQLPVVLVDDRPRDSRRATARKLGAAGYLGHPVNLSQVENGFERLVRSPARRRFSRFPHRVAVRGSTLTGPGHTASLGRLGMFVCTEREAAPGEVEPFEVALPELSTSIQVEAQTLYTQPTTAASLGGRGLLFRSFPGGGEEQWIRYLRLLSG